MSVALDRAEFDALAAEVTSARGPALSPQEQEEWDERFCAGRWRFTAALRPWASIVLAADLWAVEALFRGQPVPRRRCNPDALRVLRYRGEEVVLTGERCLRLELHLPQKESA